MRHLIVAFSVLITSLVFIGCSDRFEDKRIDNVVRVFWHKGTLYSFHVREPNSVEIKMINLPTGICDELPNKVKIFADILPGNPMWVRYVINYNLSFFDIDCIEVLEIHIHSEKDIDGGGWNHGKSGSGQTFVVR